MPGQGLVSEMTDAPAQSPALPPRDAPVCISSCETGGCVPTSSSSSLGMGPKAWIFLLYAVVFPALSNTQGFLVLQRGNGCHVANEHHPQTPAFLSLVSSLKSQLIYIRLSPCLWSNLILLKIFFFFCPLALAALIPQSIELIVLELERLTSNLTAVNMCFCFVGSHASSILHRGRVFSCHLPSAWE